jgi:hypothetical protein
MKIVVREDDSGWAPAAERFYALDRDSYDGAEDSSNRNHVGRGASRIAAIHDLFEIFADEGY